MYTDERQVARKAEQMLKSALQSKVSSFKQHAQQSTADVSLKDADAKAKVRKYGLVKNGNAKYFMRKLSIKMARHGFVQHYGVDGLREGSKRTRHIPKTTTYDFETHTMRMPAHSFISNAIESSGVVPFVLQEVTRLRSEEIMLGIKRFMEEK